MSSPQVVVHSNADLLAKAAAARLVTRLVDAQAARGVASVVLTGGGIGTATLRELRENPARDAVDWRRVDVWWGDERFVPADDGERNDRQAAEALLDAVPLDPARVHRFAASDDAPYAGNPEAAASAYGVELRKATRPEDHGSVPRFDVLLLGIGEEGHVASVFPESPAAYEERPVVAVRGCPKPPPTRLTLTFPAIAAATEVWVLAAGGGQGLGGGTRAGRRRTGAGPRRRRPRPLPHALAPRPRRRVPPPGVLRPPPRQLTAPEPSRPRPTPTPAPEPPRPDPRRS